MRSMLAAGSWAGGFEDEGGAGAVSHEEDRPRRVLGLDGPHLVGQLGGLLLQIARVLQVAQHVEFAVRPLEDANLVRHAGQGQRHLRPRLQWIDAADAAHDEDDAGPSLDRRPVGPHGGRRERREQRKSDPRWRGHEPPLRGRPGNDARRGRVYRRGAAGARPTRRAPLSKQSHGVFPCVRRRHAVRCNPGRGRSPFRRPIRGWMRVCS